MTQSEIERSLIQFEGLVKTTARQILDGGAELEYEDVCQLLRTKVWQAVCAFSETRAADGRHFSKPHDSRGRTPLQRWVFGCVLNFRRDIEKRPKRYNSSLDEIRERVQDGCGTVAEWFDARYLSVDAEQVFAEVDDEEVRLPSTLTEVERQVVTLRLDGRMLFEIDLELGLSRAQRERVMRSVREKLADWRPSSTPVRAPMPPLPQVGPRSTPLPVAQAA